MDQSYIPSLKVCVAKTLSLFEMWFPLGFFDIMIHLFIHLVDDLDICGPIVTRWCYQVERYLRMLNQFVEQSQIRRLHGNEVCVWWSSRILYAMFSAI